MTGLVLYGGERDRKREGFGDFQCGGGNGEKGEATEMKMNKMGYIIRYTWTSTKELKGSSISSKKLLETGFNYKYGLEKMFDGAIECCKQRDIL
ncbi:hypothetical protein MTR67_042844 [Solanum verrucosum]|uniref:Uncharacterized protein n=1 Tax=Solanum verrucosum TaxID=315347 RepID=A0AAF0ZUJ7_SOLVR|nr:hypothetical protein MTR67_042844 [Solanum verrucosum]